MVGLVPYLLVKMVEAQVGAPAVRKLLTRADFPVDHKFRMNRVYDDSKWRQLFEAACEVLDLTPEEAEIAFADFFCRDALQRWPMWFKISSSGREFLLRQPKIHNGFATGVADPLARTAINDKFVFEEAGEDIVVRYRSPNQLCGLFKAIANWILGYYGEEATIDESTCLKRGDDCCTIVIRWIPFAKPSRNHDVRSIQHAVTTPI